MAKGFGRCRVRKIAIAFVVVAVAGAWVQGQTQDQQKPFGGKLPEETPVRKVKTRSSANRSKSSTGVRSAKPAVAPRTGPLDSIDGKWWTTDDNFGTSQIFFTREGTSVSGVITYANGRTGNLNGVLAGRKLTFDWTNSAGQQGTGWLEQTWNNLLGGTYYTQAGKSGSRTLSRINGNWCFGGSRSIVRQVTHNARGQVFFLTQDSGQEVGHLEGPSIYLHGQFGNIKGIVSYKANRVDFATGAFWTWCGPRVPQP